MKSLSQISFLMICLVLIMALLTGCNEEKKAAVALYDSECERINTETADLNAVITECESLIEVAEEAYDPATLTTLETETADAKTGIEELPKCPSNTEEITALVNDTLKNISYIEAIDSLTAAKQDYEDSIKILKQVTNPSEAFVINCLKEVEGIVAYDAATEDNDPNGQLGKQGGYTSAVYFQYDKVNQGQTYGSTVIEKGTDCGGQIEVYVTKEDAEKRDAYLAAFDGGMLASGSHTVVGTMVVRTSSLLKASEQKELESGLISKFTELK